LILTIQNFELTIPADPDILQKRFLEVYILKVVHIFNRFSHKVLTAALLIGLASLTLDNLAVTPRLTDPEFDPVAHKVAMIMELYGCKDHRIHRAIMQTFDPVLVATVIAIESEYRENAVSPAGARGLMQLTPEKLENWRDNEANIRLGAEYLNELINRFGAVELAVAAYNAGPANVIKYKGVPPFTETLNYLNKAKSIRMILAEL
jgi:hypothetical protein